jgi:hypothetical protein
MLTPALGRVTVVGVSRRTLPNAAAPAIAGGVSSRLTLGTRSTSTGADSCGEQDGGLGFASRPASGELRRCLRLPCSLSL